MKSRDPRNVCELEIRDCILEDECELTISLQRRN